MSYLGSLNWLQFPWIRGFLLEQWAIDIIDSEIESMDDLRSFIKTANFSFEIHLLSPCTLSCHQFCVYDRRSSSINFGES